MKKPTLSAGSARRALDSSRIGPPLGVTLEKMFEEAGWLKPDSQKGAKGKKKWRLAARKSNNFRTIEKTSKWRTLR